MPQPQLYELKVKDIIQSTRTRYPDDTDVFFMARLIYSHFKGKSLDYHYQSLKQLATPQTALAALKSLSHIIYDKPSDLAPYFLHYSLGLFVPQGRYLTDSEILANQKISDVASRALSSLHVIIHISKILEEDKKAKNSMEEHERFFNQIDDLFNAGHLNLTNIKHLGSDEYCEVIREIEALTKSKIFEEYHFKDTANDGQVDIARAEKNHHLNYRRALTREKIREWGYNGLQARCLNPLVNKYRWDHHEKVLWEKKNQNAYDQVASAVYQGIRLDIEHIYTEIAASTLSRTAHEKSLLFSSLLDGYTNNIVRHKNRGFESLVDMMVFICSLNLTFALFQQFNKYLTLDNLTAMLRIREEYARSHTHTYGEFFTLNNKVIISFLQYKPNIQSFIRVSLFITACIMFHAFQAEENRLVPDFEIQALDSILIAGFLILCGVSHHCMQFGKQTYKLLDQSWAEAFLNNIDKHDKAQQALQNEERKEHQAYIAAYEQRMTEYAERANKVKDEQETIKRKAEAKLAEDEAKRAQSQKEAEARRLAEEKARKEEEAAFKEARRRFHEEKRNRIEAPALPAPGPEPVAPVLNGPAAPIPVMSQPLMMAPMPKRIPQPPLRINPPAEREQQPIVAFAFGDAARDVFINHIRQVFRITHARYGMREPLETPEDVAALKYDLLELCERLIAILSPKECNQPLFIYSFIQQAHIKYLYMLRHGIVHQDHVLTEAERVELYREVMRRFSLIADLYTAGTEIRPQALCDNAKRQPNAFPISLSFEGLTKTLFDRLTHADRRITINDAFIHQLQNKHAYLNHITDRYLYATNARETEILGKTLRSCIAEIGETYKEIYVHQKLQNEYLTHMRRLYPTQTVDIEMINRFIDARRDIVHAQDLKQGTIGVILSSAGSLAAVSDCNIALS